MQNIESYNLLVAGAIAFKQQRHKLALTYDLEKDLTLEELDKTFPNLEQMLSLDVEQDAEQVVATYKKIINYPWLEASQENVEAYKLDLRQMVKIRRQKMANLTQVSNLDFYVDKFFDYLVQGDTILADLRRHLVSYKLADQDKELKNSYIRLALKHNGVRKKILAEVEDLDLSTGYSPAQLEQLFAQVSQTPVIQEVGPNSGRMFELQSLAQSDRRFLDQIKREAVKGSDNKVDFEFEIGGKDYYLLDTELPSLMYAYPNSSYLKEALDQLEEPLSKDDYKIASTCLTAHTIDYVYNKRKKDHEQILSCASRFEQYVNLTNAPLLIRAYIGLLNTQEFTELRAVLDKFFPEINFTFASLYQAIYSQLRAFIVLSKKAKISARVRSQVKLETEDPVFNAINKSVAVTQNFQQRYKVIYNLLYSIFAEQSQEYDQHLKDLAQGLQGKASQYGLSPLATSYAQVLYGENYTERAGYIALYLAQKGEYPTHNLIKLLISQGYRVALPVMRKNWVMVFAPVRSLDYNDPRYYQKNKYGLIEPVIGGDNPLVHNSDLLVVATPVVAFDKQFNRIGMGGGYYDKLFAYYTKVNLNVLPDGILGVNSPITPDFVGLAHAWQEVPYCYPHQGDLVLNSLIINDLSPITATEAFKISFQDKGILSAYLDLAKQYKYYKEARTNKARIKQSIVVDPQLSQAYLDNFRSENEAYQENLERLSQAYAQEYELVDPYCHKVSVRPQTAYLESEDQS
ncbi:hypothetical protein CJP74_03745 [Psittacicella melopsittaci]|uniref:5-formyltetrahydrofolate cyclo-ligase n=1 Tax=Psittacicella melopsittaci TaxID=2028576 RepID=A0A3A1Y6A0_9GAMM|nr:5-formyltetrahydrofolate cyclo-ligase [Psittacicella melopsittaci]RIY32728.1 hypothetical protein CJP74_03745 [Psittacicella melopsittaci]